VKRNGFTLVETLLVVVIMGLITLMALPKLNSAFDRTGVLNAKARVMALYSTARSVAISSNQTGILRVNGNQIYVYARPRRRAPIGANTVDTIVRPVDLNTVYGVNVTGGTDSVRVSATGLGLDSATVILTKSTFVDTIFISRYGRVIK
jgi:prepilin-type N-terminal cleavage/methylation domain-containing protein